MLRKYKNYLCIVWLFLMTGCASFSQHQAESNYKRAQTAFLHGESNIALEYVNNAISHNPNNFEYYRLRMKLYSSQGQLILAQQDYQKMISIESDNFELQQEYAGFLCNKLNNFGGALYFYNKIQLHLNQINSPAAYYTDFAECMQKQGNMDAAITLYIDALGYESAPFSAYSGIVAVYSKLKNYPMANYYAQLYIGPTTLESLTMQINSLSNLLSSNTKINNRKELLAKLDSLNAQYAQLVAVSKAK